MALRCNVGRLRDLYAAKYGEATTLTAAQIRAIWLLLRLSGSDSDEHRDQLTIQVLTRMRHPVSQSSASKKRSRRRQLR